MREVEKVLPPVTMILAEQDGALRENIRLYAHCQKTVKLLDCAATGMELLDVLEGRCPDVLVLDSMIRMCGVFSVLEYLAGKAPRTRPAILVTQIAQSEELSRKFLTLGARFVMLKPYSLPELFYAVTVLGTGPGALTARRVTEHTCRRLERMRADFRCKGVWYVVQAMQQMVPGQKSNTASEVYAEVAYRENVSPDAVATAIRRANEQMQRAGTGAYAELCAFSGEGPRRLTNAEFLARLAQVIRQELGGALP